MQQLLARLFIIATTVLQQSQAKLFNSRWHDCSVTGTIVQQSLARLFNSHWHDCSTVTGTIIQQSLARLFNSGWHDSSTVAGMILQQSLARLFNSDWHDSSTVTGIILQQSLARLFNSQEQDFFFVLCWQDSSTVMFTVEEWCHVPGIRHMIPCSPLIIKSENSLIRKTNIFACDRFHLHCGIDKFCITCRKLITVIELQYYVNLRANFNLNKFENLSSRFDRQSIINQHSASFQCDGMKATKQSFSKL